MHILALKAEGRILPYIHEAMVKAFKNLGVEVDNISNSGKGDNFLLIEEKLKSSYQAIFTLNMGGKEGFLNQVREWQIKYRQPWIIWFVDDPEGYNFPQASEPAYTLAFCWDRGLIEEMAPVLGAYGSALFHLPLATDPDVFFPKNTGDDLLRHGVFVGVISQQNEIFERIIMETPGLENDVEKIWEIYKQNFSISLPDLLWRTLAQKLGQDIPLLKFNALARLWVQVCIFQLGIRKRKEVVFKLLSGGGAVWGDEGWRQIFPRDIYQGQMAYGEELNKIYNRAGFVLDLRPGQSRTGITQRVFDTTASGVPVLTEWSPELEYLYDPGEELFYFRNLKEAEEVRDLLLGNEEKARKKAAKARNRTLTNHIYLSRARHILKELKKF